MTTRAGKVCEAAGGVRAASVDATGHAQIADESCCEPPEPDCCTGRVAHLPDFTGEPADAPQSAILSVSVTDTNEFGTPWAPPLSEVVTFGAGAPPALDWDTANCGRFSANLGDGGAGGSGPAFTQQDAVAFSPIADAGYVPFAAGVLQRSESLGSGGNVDIINRRVTVQFWYNAALGRSFAIFDSFLDRVQGAAPPAQAGSVFTPRVARACVPVAITPSTQGGFFAQASAQIEVEGILQPTPGSPPIVQRRFATISASITFSGNWTVCPGKTMPTAVAADCDDPEVIECRDDNGAILDPRCCDPINPLPPSDPRCTNVGVGAGCCQDIGVAPYFIADDAYATILLWWFYRRISFFTNPNRWVADEVYVGEASLRVNLPRLGSPECSFRVSSAILAGGVNQTGDRFSQRWLNFGTEQNPDWRVESRNFLTEFTFGQTTSARLRHRIFTTATGLSNAHFDATTRATDPKCIRGTQTRQVVGWTLQCSQGEWPANNSGFYTQFVLRDTRPGLPTNGSIQGVQSDGEVNAAGALFRYGACPNPNALLLGGETSSALRLAERDADRDLLLTRASRRLVNDQETPGLRAAMLAHGATGRAALRIAANKGRARGFADRMLLRGPGTVPCRDCPPAPGAPGSAPTDPAVLAAIARQLGGCTGCGDPGVEP